APWRRSASTRFHGESLMPRLFVASGLVALLAFPALAQQAQPNQVTPIPATPAPAESRPNEGLGAGAEQREQRTRQGGAPQDTRTQTRQSQGSDPAQGGQQQSQS